MRAHSTRVYLVNTGWTGGPYGEGARIDIGTTREIVQACLSGALEEVGYEEDPHFLVSVPRTCPAVKDSSILQPRNTWKDKEAYDRRATKLADQFASHFQKAYGGKGIDPAVARQCPGRGRQ